MRSAWRSRIFLTLLGGYASYYLCRVNLAIAQPEIAAQFGWDKTEVGTIASFYYLVYAIGKLLSGIAADRFGGRVLFVTGVFGSAAANLLFPLATTLPAMTAVWSVNAFFQSMGWGALVSIMSRWYGPKEQGTAMGLISTSYQVGNAAAWGFMQLLLLSMPWAIVFTVPAIAFFVIGVASWFLLRNDPREVALPSPHAELNVGDAAAKEAEESGKAAAKEIVRRTLLSPYLWAICLISLLLTFVRYTFINWAPSYVAERSAAAAGTPAGETGDLAKILELVAFPLVGCAGSIFTGWFSDRFSAARRAPIIAATCLGLAATLVAFGFAAGAPTGVVITLLSLAGFMLYGPYALLAGAIAIDLGSRHAAATAAGIIDGVGYLGAVVSGAGMGWLIERVGWENSFFVLAGAAGLCVVVSLFLWRVRPAGAS